MKKISGANKRYLKSLAHNLDPLVHIGKMGLTENIVTNIGDALLREELVKIRFHVPKEYMQECLSEICEQTESALVDKVGFVAIFYRTGPDRKIRLPQPGAMQN